VVSGQFLRQGQFISPGQLIRRGTTFWPKASRHRSLVQRTRFEDRHDAFGQRP